MATIRSTSQHDDITFAVETITMGKLLVATSARGVCAVLLGDDDEAVEAELRAHFPGRLVTRATDGSHRVAREVAARLDTDRGAGDDIVLDVQRIRWLC